MMTGVKTSQLLQSSTGKTHLRPPRQDALPYAAHVPKLMELGPPPVIADVANITVLFFIQRGSAEVIYPYYLANLSDLPTCRFIGIRRLKSIIVAAAGQDPVLNSGLSLNITYAGEIGASLPENPSISETLLSTI